METGAEPLHASAVAVGAAGLLILGSSGSGKSALALALIARGAELVSDDRVVVRPEGEGLVLAPPEPIAGLIEARGIGLIRMPWREAPLVLAADLSHAPPGRLPPRRRIRLHERDVPLLLCRACPGLADTLIVLLRHGRLVDPEGDTPAGGHGSAE